MYLIKRVLFRGANDSVSPDTSLSSARTALHMLCRGGDLCQLETRDIGPESSMLWLSYLSWRQWGKFSFENMTFIHFLRDIQLPTFHPRIAAASKVESQRWHRTHFPYAGLMRTGELNTNDSRNLFVCLSKLALLTIQLHVIQGCHEDDLHCRTGLILPDRPAKLHYVVQSATSISTTDLMLGLEEDLKVQL